MYNSADALIHAPKDMRPHVVLLGAGASKAAFPNGDANGRRVPIMGELVDAVNLQSIIERAGLNFESGTNFETFYSEISSKPSLAEVRKEIEGKIEEYFRRMQLPESVTIYDQLLLSLREKDAIFTFNWDPFLFDAYQRNCGVVPLPQIFFLHGNVRIAMCSEHPHWGGRGLTCPECGNILESVPLLYPVKNKDYTSIIYMRDSWGVAKDYFKEAFTLTFFGYGAPESDAAAVQLLHGAWLAESARKFEHIQIIDVASPDVIRRKWSAFTPTHHYHQVKDFSQSRIAQWPRRSCEALFLPMTEGVPCGAFPFPKTSCLEKLQTVTKQISQYEK